jgi:hypothetical protein
MRTVLGSMRWLEIGPNKADPSRSEHNRTDTARINFARLDLALIELGKTTAPPLLAAIMLIAWVSALGQPVASALPPSITTAPLSVDQVVNNLVRRNAERAQALRHYQATRIYHLSYRGFPGERDAEMVVEATYDSPSTKTFRVISQKGSKFIIDRVLKRLLQSEQDATEPEIHDSMMLNRNNYDIALVGYESSDHGNQYVLYVTPKEMSKYVYRGKVWVDATDFAVTRIDAEPAENPSFWTKKSEFHHEYTKVQDFWLPWRNESVSQVRLGGRATLTIEYTNYHVVDSRVSLNTPSTAAGPGIQ